MPEFDEPLDPGQAQDPAMVDTPHQQPPEDDEADEHPDGAEDVPEQDPEQAADSTGYPEEAPDEYSGPNEEQIVGDDRGLHVFALRTDYEPGETPVGEAWQDESGQVHGSGMLAVMLFELGAKQRYLNASIARDLSPLAIMQKRLARASLFRTQLMEGDNESE